jgi:hypothetical protein
MQLCKRRLGTVQPARTAWRRAASIDDSCTFRPSSADGVGLPQSSSIRQADLVASAQRTRVPSAASQLASPSPGIAAAAGGGFGPRIFPSRRLAADAARESPVGRLPPPNFRGRSSFCSASAAASLPSAVLICRFAV